MEMKLIILVVSMLFFDLADGQISMIVKELPTEKHKKYIPNNDPTTYYELSRHPGHVLEVKIRNDSDKSISFPLDTISYAMPFTENVKEYYNGRQNITPSPDLFNALGIYGFVYQNGIFKNYDLATAPFYEEKQLMEIAKTKKLRQESIDQWNSSKKINDELIANYNWYIMNHMVTILPGQSYKYKFYFNPYVKKIDEYGYEQYYFQLDEKKPYDVIFKLILPKKIYNFLTKEDKMKYPNLFVGVIASAALELK